MTTAGVLLTISNAWSVKKEKPDTDRIYRDYDMARVAEKELRETPHTREQALRIMREWLMRNPDVENVREDDNFLLRFLRHKKYSILMAQQTLLKYLNLRSYYPVVSRDLDCENPAMKELIETGYIVVSPVRDTNGRRVVIYNISKIDPNKYGCWDILRLHCLVGEVLMEYPADQVFGFTHIGDGDGFCTGHILSWNPTDFARIFKWGEQSYPMRHKEFHLINLPSGVKYILDFACSKVTSKMSQRLHVHASLSSLHKKVDRACLPTAYGGNISFEDMIGYTKQLLREQRNNVLRLDKMKILSTRGIISSRNKCSNEKVDGDISIQGSFRKLNID